MFLRHVPGWFRPAFNDFAGARERARFWFYPKLANLQLNAATFTAKRRLARKPALRILVDNSILGLGVTHETRWISTGPSTWGTQVIDTGYAARVPVHARGNRSKEFRNVLYLTGICHLARRGAVELCHSAELWNEQFRHPNGTFFGYGCFDYSLFSGLQLASVDGFAFPSIGPDWLGLPSLAQQQRERIEANADELYRGIYRVLSEQLGKKCDQDCWHLRTAEVHGLYCFLTADWNLLKAVRSLRHKEPLKSLRTKVVSPTELGAELGLWPVSPHVLSYENASWIVRPDQSMPGERRRRRSEYRNSRPA